MGDRARCRYLRSNHLQGILERIGDTLTHEIDYGTLSWIETKRPGLTHAEKYRIYLKRVHDMEKSIGRRLTPSELERFTRAFNASASVRIWRKFRQSNGTNYMPNLKTRGPLIAEKNRCSSCLSSPLHPSSKVPSQQEASLVLGAYLLLEPAHPAT